jgi:hypothetical protein
MQTSTSTSLLKRVLGALRPNGETYLEIAHDPRANVQAAIVVILAALAGGIGSLTSDRPLLAFFAGTVGLLVAWSAYAATAYGAGTRLFADPPIAVDRGQLWRSLGFAYAPMLFTVFGVLPSFLGYLVCFAIAPAWVMWTTSVALLAVLGVETNRARNTAILAGVVLLIVMSLVGGLSGAGVYGEGGML